MPRTVRVLIEAEFVADNELAAMAVLLRIPNELGAFIEVSRAPDGQSGVKSSPVQVKIVHQDIF